MRKITCFGAILMVLFVLSACGHADKEQSPEMNSNYDASIEESAYSDEEDDTETAQIELTTAEEITQVGQFDFEKKTVMLNSGYEMPIIGLGTWTLNDDEAENSVYHALKSGMRLIDTARYYGNEVGVGRGLQKAIDEGVYKAMEEAVNDGKLRSIGISNYYTKEQVDEVLSFAKIVPAVIQNENHIYYQNSDLQEYVSRYGIVIESWYPFGGRGHTSENFNNAVILEMAEKYNKSSAQIILRWQLQAGFIAIPGSSNPEHISENYDVFDFELTGEDMQKFKELDKRKRYENW